MAGLTHTQTIDQYFMEHRAKVLDVAAFLDRVDRAAAGGGGRDVRMAALLKAIAILHDGMPDRARRVLELMSDPTTEAIPRAGDKSAIGVWPGGPSEDRS